MLVPRPLLFGGILVLASLGAYSLNRSMLDLVLLYAVGAVGCAMRVYDVPLVPAVLGLVLGPLVGAAVPPRAGDQRRRPVGVRDAPDLCAMLLALAGRAAGPLRQPAGASCGDGWRPCMTRPTSMYDVVVVGGGNAGAVRGAHGARGRARASSCSKRRRAHFRGGNSRHTRNLRCAHDAPTDVLTGAYSEDEFLADLLRVNDGETDEALARLRRSAHRRDCPAWMRRLGVRFQPSLRGTLHLSRTNAFFLGGGKALMNSYYAAAERLGIERGLRRRGRRARARRAARSAARVAPVDGGSSTIRASRRGRRGGRIRSRTSSGCARSGATPPTTSSSAARRTTRARCSG